jgi:hypothetical protein
MVTLELHQLTRPGQGVISELGVFPLERINQFVTCSSRVLLEFKGLAEIASIAAIVDAIEVADDTWSTASFERRSAGRDSGGKDSGDGDKLHIEACGSILGVGMAVVVK